MERLKLELLAQRIERELLNAVSSIPSAWFDLDIYMGLFHTENGQLSIGQRVLLGLGFVVIVHALSK